MITEKTIKGLKIDPTIFSFPFHCRCKGECCNYGVYTDKKEFELILSIKDKIIPLMDETQPKEFKEWFEAPEKDLDFESGIAVGTQVINGKCVFLDKNGLCVLQKLALIENENKWKYKPIYCVLFPLTVYENTLTIDDEHIDRLSSCNFDLKNQTTIFEFCEQELEHLLGEDGLAELKLYRDEYLNMQNGR
jgi:Fe-S-cluster containining protein